MKREQVKDLMVRIKAATSKVKEIGFNQEIDDLHKEIIKKDNLTKYFILKSLQTQDSNIFLSSPYAIFANCAEDKKIFQFLLVTMYVNNREMTDAQIKSEEVLKQRLNVNDNDLNRVLDSNHAIEDGMLGLIEYVDVVREVFQSKDEKIERFHKVHSRICILNEDNKFSEEYRKLLSLFQSQECIINNGYELPKYHSALISLQQELGLTFEKALERFSSNYPEYRKSKFSLETFKNFFN